MQQSTQDDTKKANGTAASLPGSSKAHVVQIQMETALNQITQGQITPKDLAKETIKVDLNQKDEHRRRNTGIG